MERNATATTGKAIPAPEVDVHSVANESVLNTTPGGNSIDRGNQLEGVASQGDEVINLFLAQYAVQPAPSYTDWPKNVSVFASSRFDQTSGTNDRARSRTGVYTDALLDSAGLGGPKVGLSNFFAQEMVHSFGRTHALAQFFLTDRGGLFGSLKPPSTQTPQMSTGAAALPFREKISPENHAVLLSGFDSRHSMHRGFKDDVENMHRLTRKLGIPEFNVGEFSNVKSSVFEAYLKDYRDKTGDNFVIYYSGHGSSKLSEKGRAVAEESLMKRDRLSAQQAENVVNFIAGRGSGARFVSFGKLADSIYMKLLELKYPDQFREMREQIQKESGLSKLEFESALGLLRHSHGSSSFAVRTSVFKSLGANDPKHYDGVLHSRDAITEPDLKRMTAQYLSGFKNVVIITDTCYAGALIANRGLERREVSKQSPERTTA